MRKLTFEEACFQWASGFYLTEHVFWTGHMIEKEIGSLAYWVENGKYPKKEDYDN